MRAWRAHRGGYGSGGSGMERAFGIVCSALAESGCGKQPGVAGCKEPLSLFHGAAVAFLPAAIGRCRGLPWAGCRFACAPTATSHGVVGFALGGIRFGVRTYGDEPWGRGAGFLRSGWAGRTAVSVRTVVRCNAGVRVNLKGAVRSRTGLTGFAIRGITALLPRRNQAPLTKKEGKRLLPLLGNWSGKRVSNSRPQPWQG